MTEQKLRIQGMGKKSPDHGDHGETPPVDHFCSPCLDEASRLGRRDLETQNETGKHGKTWRMTGSGLLKHTKKSKNTKTQKPLKG